MRELTKKIDAYLVIQEKKEAISESFNEMKLDDVIELFKKSSKKEKFLSSLDKDMRKEIQKLIDGGII